MSCDVIAEAGVNHGGSLARALDMLKAAREAGCNGFKVQCYTAEEFVGPDETYTYLERDGNGGFRRVTERQRAMFDRCALTWDAVRALHAECSRVKMRFVATATDAGWIERLKTLDPWPILKVGSDDLIHLPLLRACAESGMQVYLSTGMASEDEVARAVSIVRPSALLHCVSLYPTPIIKANLLRMEALRKHCPIVGFSDHTEGTACAMLACAMGASVIEKHFTLGKDLQGPDHWFSADPAEMRQLVTLVRSTVATRGTGEVEPTAAEREMRVVARRSVVAARDIAAGSVLRQDMLAYRRPGTGMHPGTEGALVGRVTSRAVPAGQAIDPSMFREVAH